MGQLNIGTVVECTREDDDDELEQCTVKALDSSTGLLDLAFGDGFVRKAVSVQAVKIIESNLTPKEAPPMPNIAPATASASALPPAVDADDESAYADEVGPQLPSPPTAAALTETPDAKYDYIKAYKDVGNALFKAAKYAWAIKTYTAAVDALVTHCYESRERMLWDYFARTPCGQCYSNAALCALKLGDAARAARLCDTAMTCRPEDTDLVKVLLRHGQALLALNQPDAAKAALDRAADKEPQNRAVREELLKAKKAVNAAAKADAAALFRSVDLNTTGLTSKKESVIEQLQHHLDAGFEALGDHKDEKALRHLTPLLEGSSADAPHRRPTTMLACYGVGLARYQMRNSAEALSALGLFFRIKAKLDAEGVEYKEPLMGLPIARFYYAHSLFEAQKLAEAKEQALKYLEDVAAAGPQRILNMPSGMMGKTITDLERAASRFKTRASSNEALADAHTMLAIVSERLEGPTAALAHFDKCLELGNDKQQVDAHENLANTYKHLGEDAKADEHRELALAVKMKIANDEADAAKKKAKDEEEEGHNSLAESDVKEEEGEKEPVPVE